MKLGERLQAIAVFAAGGGPVADIGTDHAYLPIYLVLHDYVSKAIAVEVKEGPYQAARDMIERSNLAKQIDLRFGNGLEPLRVGEADTVTIAGMGGATIVDILNARPAVTASIKRLVLQPMIAAGTLRRWLAANGWSIIDETLVVDEGRLYEIIAAEPGRSAEFEDILYEIGPVLWAKRSPLLERHIDQLLSNIERILEEMTQSPTAIQSLRYEELSRRKLALEEKRKCL